MIDKNTKKIIYLRWLFLAIAISAIGLVLYKYDFEILFFIQDHIRNGLLDKIVPLYTSLGNAGIIWIIIGLVMLIPKKTRKCGVMVLAALLVMLIVNNIILKNLIARPRPCVTYPEMVTLVKIPSSYSFPSGHTVSSMAAAFTILTQHKKLGIVALVIATLMGLSRLYVFVHFPTDVYAGIILGGAIALGVYYAEKKISPKIAQKLQK